MGSGGEVPVLQGRGLCSIFHMRKQRPTEAQSWKVVFSAVDPTPVLWVLAGPSRGEPHSGRIGLPCPHLPLPREDSAAPG